MSAGKEDVYRNIQELSVILSELVVLVYADISVAINLYGSDHVLSLSAILLQLLLPGFPERTGI